MTSQTPEAVQNAPAFSYAALDDISDEAAIVVLAYWRLRPTLPEADWLDLVVGVLVRLILQAEQLGRAYGLGAVALDGDPILPVDDTPRRPAPEDFLQRSDTAPAPDPVIDFGARGDELTKRIEKAVTTLARAPEDLARVERLARDEPIAATQRGYQDGVRLQAEIEIVGYRRGINPDCCELCFWLWKEGYVYDIDQPMHRHTGCRCVPVPTTDSIGPTPVDDAGRAQLDRYYNGEIADTTYRRNTA